MFLKNILQFNIVFCDILNDCEKKFNRDKKIINQLINQFMKLYLK